MAKLTYSKTAEYVFRYPTKKSAQRKVKELSLRGIQSSIEYEPYSGDYKVRTKKTNPPKAKLGHWIKAKKVRFLPRGIVQIMR